MLSSYSGLLIRINLFEYCKRLTALVIIHLTAVLVLDFGYNLCVQHIPVFQCLTT